MKELTYKELKQEARECRLQAPFPHSSTLTRVEPYCPIGVDEIYPTLCRVIENENIHSKTKAGNRWACEQLTRYICKKYNVAWKGYDDGCQRFILHSDGTYTEVTE